MSKKTVLIADPDLEYYEKFKHEPDWGKVKLILVGTGSEAQAKIKELKGEFAAVIISPELSKPSGVSVIKFSLQSQPTVPVHLIESLNANINESFVPSSLGLTGSLAKPFNLATLIKYLGPALDIFDLNSALEVSKHNKDSVDTELDDSDPNFRPIKAELFISGSKSLFDVYVRLRKDKFIKILQAGDTFDVERVLVYLNKGVTYFHIRKEALESYVSYCDRLTNAISTSEKIPLEKKFGFVFNQAEVTLNTMVDLGVDNDSIVYAQKYLKNVCSLVDGYSQDSSFLSELLKEVGQFEHSGGVVLISSVVAKEAGIESEKGIQSLGLAAFLHDVGFIEESDAADMYSDGKDIMHDEVEVKAKLDSKKVYGDEKALLEKLWFQHAEIGARRVEHEKNLPPLVPQIIRQHHSQRDKREGRHKGGAIHPMAEILELSDCFIRLSKQYNEGVNANKKIFVSKLLEEVSEFPKRTREPFMIAFKLLPKT